MTSADKELLPGDQGRKLSKRVEKVVNAEKKYDEARRNLESNWISRRDTEKGRQPSATAWWYVLALLGGGAVEWLLNYESFSGLFGVPALATGSTVLVAVMVAFASHMHGEWCRQPIRREQLRAGKQSEQGYRWVFWGVSVSLLVVFGFVVTVRFLSWSELSELGLELSVWPKVLTTLADNVIVWVIGGVLSFFAHSEGHYTKQHRIADRARRRYERANRSRTKYVGLLDADRSAVEKERLSAVVEGEFDKYRRSSIPMLFWMAVATFLR